MANIGVMLKGVFLFLFANVFFYLAQFIYTAVLDSISDEPILYVFGWVGLILCYVLTALIIPVYCVFVAAKDDNADVKLTELIKGNIYYIGGTIAAYAVWYILGGGTDGGLIGAFEGVYTILGMDSGYLSYISWFGVMIVYALFVVIKPMAHFATGMGITGGNK